MDRLGRYELLGELARGGMGVVYRARDPGSGAQVAIKVLLRGEASTPRARKRFEREAQALRKIRHPHVVEVLDAALTPSGQPYLVLELVEGESLEALLARRGPLPVEEALETVITLCDAVAACHEAGVLHRDLKPENVLCTRDGQPKLTDFGLVRDVDPSLSRTQLTQDGDATGSPGYWSPEQAQGHLDLVGPATDVYGLGGILFALLTGRPPQSGATLVEIVSRLDEPQPAPSSVTREVPAWLDAVVLRALARRPAQRFAGPLDLADALRAGRTTTRTQPVVWVVALALILAGALGAGWVVRQAGRDGAEAPPVVGGAAPNPSQSPSPQTSRSPLPGLDPAAADAAIARGQQAVDAGDFAAALLAFDEATQLDPTSARGFLRRGAAHAKLGDWRAALADSTRAIELRPDDAVAYANRGHAHVGLGDPEQAVRDATTALELDPDLLQAYSNRASVYFAQGELQRALADYEHAVRLAPDDPDQLINRGAVKGRLGDYPGMLSDCTRALELDPENATAWSNRATAHQRLGDDANAIADATQALQRNPGDVYVRMVRAGARYRERDLEGALADYTQVLQASPRDAAMYLCRASVRSDLDDHAGAVEDYSRAIDLAPQAPKAYLSRGVSRMALNDAQGALADYTRAIEGDPTYAIAYVNRGTAWLQLQESTRTIADWEQALALAPDASWAETLRQQLSQVRQQRQD